MQPDYSRQILLKDVGTAGQAILAQSRVLIVGAGGLGSPVLQYLAGAGVGLLGVVEADLLHASNLHRQPIYELAQAGRPKAALAAAAVAKLNPDCAGRDARRAPRRRKCAAPRASPRCGGRLHRQFPHQIPHQRCGRARRAPRRVCERLSIRGAVAGVSAARVPWVPALRVGGSDGRRSRRQLRRGGSPWARAGGLRRLAGALDLENPAQDARTARGRAAAHGLHDLHQHEAQSPAQARMRRAPLRRRARARAR